MLVSVAVAPWPPALVPQLMGRAAPELDSLRVALDATLRGVVRPLTTAGAPDPRGDGAGGSGAGEPGPGPAAGQIVVVGPGEHAEFDAAGVVSFADFGPDVQVPALPGGDHQLSPDLPTPLMVGRYLAHRVVGEHPAGDALWAGARWMTTDVERASSLGEALRDDSRPTALVLLVDGAASHGPKAPRAEDSRAGRFDDLVADALESGDPARLAAVDLELAHELGADGAHLWQLLAAAATGASWQGELLWRGQPYGVGWTVASWRRR
jgi:hypothetical protein